MEIKKFNQDFSLIGILAKVATVLADNGISIFAVSTYNTVHGFKLDCVIHP